MRIIFAAFLLSLNVAVASVREVLDVSQALSFHETDTAESFNGELIQAGIRSSPMVLSGAMPEVLVEAVARPHRLASIGGVPFAENNLLVLCQIRLTAEMKEKVLMVTFDISDITLPKEVELSARTVLNLGITALKRTLEPYYAESHEPFDYRIEIIGTNEKNASLKDLAKKGTLKK